MVSSFSSRHTPHASRLTTDSKICVVPLFLSTKSQRSMYQKARSQRSHTSTHSLIDPDPAIATAPAAARLRREGARSLVQEELRRSSLGNGSDLYGGYAPARQPSMSSLEQEQEQEQEQSSLSVSSQQSRSTASSNTTRRPLKRNRRTSTRTARLAVHVAAKKRLAVCFGVTLLVATLIYVALALSRKANGALFHVLSILLLLALSGVAAHSTIRWLMLRSERRELVERRDRKRKSPRERGWDIGAPTLVSDEGVLGDDEVPESPVEVFMREDHVEMEEDVEGGFEGRGEGLAGPVKPPPPVYGNFRDSVRMNPNFLHVHRVDVPVSPSTPTYEEAVSMPVMPGMAGYRPPSYGSEGGLTAVLETRRRDVEEAMGRIHPLERERMENLLHVPRHT